MNFEMGNIFHFKIYDGQEKEENKISKREIKWSHQIENVCNFELVWKENKPFRSDNK